MNQGEWMVPFAIDESEPAMKVLLFSTQPLSAGFDANVSFNRPPADIDSTDGIELLSNPSNISRRRKEPYISQSNASRCTSVLSMPSKPEMLSPVRASTSVHCNVAPAGMSALMCIGAYGPSASKKLFVALYPKVGLVQRESGGITTFTSSTNQ